MMLITVFLALLVGIASGHEFQAVLAGHERSISSQVEDLIEAAKLQMPCGFPGLGIPPLAPLKFEHKELNTHGDALDLKAEMDKIRVYGLNEFDIEELKISTLRSSVTFKFKWPQVQVKMLYDMLVKLNAIGLFPAFSRNGNVKLEIHDFIVWGTAKYSLGLLGGGLRLKELKIYASIANVQSEIENLSGIGIVNRKINEIIEETIMLAVNDNTNNIAIITNDYIMPKVNAKIGDKSLRDLIAMIGGGSGGSSGETEVCIPPTIEDYSLLL